MPDTTQEKTEKATPRKIRRARREGQVARSTEMNSVVVISFGFLTIYLLGPILFNTILTLMRESFMQAPTVMLSPTSLPGLFTHRIFTFTAIVGPMLLALAVFAYAINVTQTGFMFSVKAIEPKIERFDIIKGLKRLVSKRSMVEMVRDVIKIILISIVAYYTVSGWLPKLMMLGDAGIGDYAATLGKLSLILALKISVVFLVVAVFDFAFQRYDYAKNLRMTKQEVREELKETEGNPQLKGRIRQVQREMARQRMMTEIPKADVVVTNPTHLAVALRYDPKEMPAPMVVAKGQRLIAEKIKEIARENNVPVLENRPLAQSLFKLVDVGNFIPNTLYRAVAEVLAYVYRLQESGGVGRG
jgi:flagellar biosynthetic protein FlhB